MFQKNSVNFSANLLSTLSEKLVRAPWGVLAFLCNACSRCSGSSGESYNAFGGIRAAAGSFVIAAAAAAIEKTTYRPPHPGPCRSGSTLPCFGASSGVAGTSNNCGEPPVGHRFSHPFRM